MWLVVIGCFQVILFWVQLYYIRRSLTDAKEAADSARDSAIAATRQAEISEKMLVQRERPYIFIFGISSIRRKSDPDFDDAYFIEYTVANHGQMPAIIEAAWIGFETSDCAEPGRPVLVDDGHVLTKNQVMASGERRTVKQFFPSGMIAGEAGIIISLGENEPETVIPALNVPNDHDVFFKAIVSYRGPFSEGHETAIELMYQGGSDQFVSRGGLGNYIR